LCFIINLKTVFKFPGTYKRTLLVKQHKHS
jgi:hypothetical protein